MLKIKFKNVLKCIHLEKFIIFISLILISFNVHSQSKLSTLDSSLLKIIFMSLDHKVGKKLIIYNISENEILWIKKNKPEPLWENIKKLYNISDDNIVSDLIPKKYSSKFLFNEKSKDINLRFGNISDKEVLSLKIIQSTSFTKVIDSFLILYNQKGDKCLISYHILDNGEHFIFLKKRNGVWLIEYKYETLE